MPCEITLSVKKLTKDLILNLKKSDPHFYRSQDKIIIYSLQDHLLRLKSEGKLDSLISKNPQLKQIVSKVIYPQNQKLSCFSKFRNKNNGGVK